MNINNLIVQEALKDKGKKEKKGNSGWEDPEFQLQMEMTGWELGQAWCAYWTEKVWTNAYAGYNSLMINILRRLFSANAVATYEAFDAHPSFVTFHEPVDGAIAIWMKMVFGKPSYVGDTKWIRGHAGIVMPGWNADQFPTLEGNGNQSGGREGIEVAELVRKYDFTNDNGLRLMGFIHPLS